jgi:hypothetical protein
VIAPTDIIIKAVNIKLAKGAHTRAKDIARRNRLKLQDVFSGMLLRLPEEDIVRAAREHAAAEESMPKAVRGVVENAHLLTDADKKAIIDALS